MQTEDAPDFAAHLRTQGLPALRRARVRTLQLNIGKRCNLACNHCHVESGPQRQEMMDRRGVERVIGLLAANPDVTTLDITGGAPELNEHFRFVVREARALGRRVIDRCNLTVFYEPGQQDTPDFLAEQGVEIVASLPCYTRSNVEAQRGRGVFDLSIKALQWLNQLGYARAGSELRLDLVYNPPGSTLPPDQHALEADYRSELRELFDIQFDALLTITNMPILRFARDLERSGRSGQYMDLLVDHFNPETVPGLMCRDLVSIGYDGSLYDCDFNQMLELDLAGGTPRTIWQVENLAELEGDPIATASHCFGCTAGAGSSCGGSLA